MESLWEARWHSNGTLENTKVFIDFRGIQGRVPDGMHNPRVLVKGHFGGPNPVTSLLKPGSRIPHTAYRSKGIQGFKCKDKGYIGYRMQEFE